MLDGNELVTQNMGLVYTVAKKFINRGTEFEDLVQIGSIGLIKASKKFNEELGYQFSTYAVNLIIGEIKRYLRDDGIVKISRKIKENMTKIKLAAEYLRKEMDREPTIKELSEYVNLPEEDIIQALNSENILNIENSVKIYGTVKTGKSCNFIY